MIVIKHIKMLQYLSKPRKLLTLVIFIIVSVIGKGKWVAMIIRLFLPKYSKRGILLSL